MKTKKFERASKVFSLLKELICHPVESLQCMARMAVPESIVSRYLHETVPGLFLAHESNTTQDLFTGVVTRLQGTFQASEAKKGREWKEVCPRLRTVALHHWYKTQRIC